MHLHYEELSGRFASRHLLCYRVEVPRFDFYLHYHPAYELTYILQGEGQRLVGAQQQPFGPGDLVLLNSAVPHTWYGGEGGGRAVVVQFGPDLLQAFADWEEFEGVGRMFAALQGALVFEGSELADAMEALADAQGLGQLAGLLAVFDRLSRTPYTVLGGDFPAFLKQGEERINKVCRYVQDHYAEPLGVAQLAELLHLSPSAFCKFFKKHTGETFSLYVNRLRLAAACKRLRHTDAPLGEIALACGFESQSYFNRVFQRQMGMSPGAYRRGA